MDISNFRPYRGHRASSCTNASYRKASTVILTKFFHTMWSTPGSDISLNTASHSFTIALLFQITNITHVLEEVSRANWGVHSETIQVRACSILRNWNMHTIGTFEWWHWSINLLYDSCNFWFDTNGLLVPILPWPVLSFLSGCTSIETLCPVSGLTCRYLRIWDHDFSTRFIVVFDPEMARISSYMHEFLIYFWWGNYNSFWSLIVYRCAV